MLLPAPNLDDRTADRIVDVVRQLAPFYTPEWQVPETSGADLALVQNVAQLLWDVVQHLNLAPAKNFVAFLSELGITLQPARPARVPLTFTLAAGTPGGVLIPARTQAATLATAEQPEVVFETEQPLLAIGATLQAVYSVQPALDAIYRHGLGAQPSANSTLFTGQDRQEHSIFLAHSELFALQSPAVIELQWVIATPRLTQADFTTNLSWEWWDHDHWVPSTVPAFQDAAQDFPAVTTVQSTLASGVTAALSVTTDVGSDARFPASGFLLLDHEIVRYEAKQGNTFTDLTRGFGGPTTLTPVPGASAPQPHNPGVPVRAIAHPLIVHAAMDTTQSGRQMVTITLSKNFPGAFGTSTVQGIENIWLRCRILRSVALHNAPLRKLLLDTVQARTVITTAIQPDELFHNDIALAPPTTVQPIYPFGTQPRLLDTFYIASDDAFSKKGASITLDLHMVMGPLLSPPVSVRIDPLFVWEYWNGTGWVGLHVTPNSPNVFKTSDQFTMDFSCPDDIAAVSVNGQEHFWIRVRIVGGSYGTFRVNTTTNEVVPLFTFPSVDSLTITYHSAPQALEQCLVSNNLEVQNHTENTHTAGTLFQPWPPLEDHQPTCYFGFDKPLVGSPIGLFFALIKQEYTEEMKPRLQWQYWNGQTWTLLDVLDDTDNLTRSGVLQIVGPVDFAARQQFGAGLFWLRAVDVENRWQLPTPTGNQSEAPPAQGAAARTVSTCLTPACPELLEVLHPRLSRTEQITLPPPPILRGMFLNTMWAIQAESIRDEILGSSNGRAGQQYTLLRRPVVSQEIWVNEINTLQEAERHTLAAQDATQIQEIRDDQGLLTHAWVRWRTVEDLLTATPTSRDYVIDRVTGTVQFGNGVRGMIPPLGQDNIKATYQFGGGAHGNSAAGTVTSLKSSVAGVDAVTNPEPAGGGAETEGLAGALERGPQMIKHRQRAMAREDFEWLARQASTSIAKVRCLPTTNQYGAFETGAVVVIIAPHSQEAQPLPSAELVQQVKRYLGARCPNVVSAADTLVVTGPAYVEVSVTAEVFTPALDLISQVQSAAIKKLQTFLHPLTGGPEGVGWDFGRLVCLSDLIVELETVLYVDHVDNVTMQLRDVQTNSIRTITDEVLLAATLPPYAMIFSGEHTVTVTLQAQRAGI